MSARHSSQLGIILVAALWSLPSVAMEASNKEAIRLLANEAASEYEAGHYNAALEKFQRAFDTAKVPRLAVWLAKTQAKLGHLVVANEMYRQALNLEKNDLWVGTTQQEAQQEAEQELAALQPRIPRLTVRVEGANPNDVALRIDDVDVPSTLIGVERLVDPGLRQIVGRVGDKEVREQATLAEGERKEIVLTFFQSSPTFASPVNTEAAPKQPVLATAVATPQSSTLQVTGDSHAKAQRTWGWVSLGIGAAGAVFGATTGVMTIVQHGKLSSDCPNHQCLPPYWSDSRSFDTLRHLTTIGFVVAGVGAATGVTLLLTSPKNESKPTASLWLAPASAGVKGKF